MSAVAWSQLADDHIARAEKAVRILAPYWSARTLHVLLHNGPMRQADAKHFIPEAPQTSLRAALERLTDLQLLARVSQGNATYYTLIAAGRAARPALQALADWARRHSRAEPATPRLPEERALQRLSSAITLPLLKVIAETGPTTYRQAATHLRITSTLEAVRFHLRKIAADGLVENLGGRPARFSLADSAKSLPPVVEALAAFAPHVPQNPRIDMRLASHRPAAQPPQRPAYRPGDLFSHAALAPAFPGSAQRRR